MLYLKPRSSTKKANQNLAKYSEVYVFQTMSKHNIRDHLFIFGDKS